MIVSAHDGYGYVVVDHRGILLGGICYLVYKLRKVTNLSVEG
jgi:hypothetical protein